MTSLAGPYPSHSHPIHFPSYSILSYPIPSSPIPFRSVPGSDCCCVVCSGAGMIIAVLLGVAILVLLAVLGYCLLKGKKKDQQARNTRVGMNGTHAHTLEDTEKLVYNSTTKPI